MNKTDQKKRKDKAYNGVYILFQWIEFGNKIVGKYRLVISAITEETWEKKNVGLRTTISKCMVRKGVTENMASEQRPERGKVSVSGGGNM